MSQPMIEVKSLSKRYRLGAFRGGQFLTFRDRLAGMFRKRRPESGDRKDEFWALKEVSFDLERGEAMGIIGANGAGKSTLLKLLSRITEPTNGEIVLRGRVASLLEVGTGFHPELTGRENIYLNGVVLGMRRSEIAKKFDAIVAFSGVEKFLDTPVKRYSSGMYVRLAFAVASHLEPEILVVDEVLAVGDAAFQEKCLGKMGEMAGSGRTILFVSHNMAAVESLTRRSVVLDHGRLAYSGPTAEAVAHYLQPKGGGTALGVDLRDAARPTWLAVPKLRFTDACLPELDAGRVRGSIRLRVGIEAKEGFVPFNLVVKVNTRDGQPLGTAFLSSDAPVGGQAPMSFEAVIQNPGLAPGHYNLSLILMTAGRNPADAVLHVLPFEIVGEQVIGEWAWRSDWGHVHLQGGALKPLTAG